MNLNDIKPSAWDAEFQHELVHQWAFLPLDSVAVDLRALKDSQLAALHLFLKAKLAEHEECNSFAAVLQSLVLEVMASRFCWRAFDKDQLNFKEVPNG